MEGEGEGEGKMVSERRQVCFYLSYVTTRALDGWMLRISSCCLHTAHE